MPGSPDAAYDAWLRVVVAWALVVGAVIAITAVVARTPPWITGRLMRKTAINVGLGVILCPLWLFAWAAVCASTDNERVCMVGRESVVPLLISGCIAAVLYALGCMVMCLCAG